LGKPVLYSNLKKGGSDSRISAPASRPLFVHNLAAVLAPAGNYFMLCFSDLEPAGYGSRRITKREIQDSFSDGWTINYIRPAIFESRTRAEGPRAWLSSRVKK
jgi:hypothetical protein